MKQTAFFEATLAQMVRLPPECRIGAVLRHSERDPILRPEDTFTAMLTKNGVREAEELGRALAEVRKPGRLFSSPIERCRDTAQAISRAANWKMPVVVDQRLSHPFIAPAWNALPKTWRKDPIPTELVRLIDFVLEMEEAPGVVDIFCTHDTIVGALAGYFMGCQFTYPTYWPDYLEGVFIWKQAGAVHVRWRDQEQILEVWPEPVFHQLQLDI